MRQDHLVDLARRSQEDYLRGGQRLSKCLRNSDARVQVAAGATAREKNSHTVRHPWGAILGGRGSFGEGPTREDISADSESWHAAMGNPIVSSVAAGSRAQDSLQPSCN